MTDPLLPLRQLAEPLSGDDPGWHERAIAACIETLSHIDRLAREIHRQDRDTQAFLDAIRHSLEWVLTEQASSGEIVRVLQRTSRMFDHASAMIH
ncbi:MAG: hypothetical protein R3E83_15860 [Burkholderiaceae bacterium]